MFELKGNPNQQIKSRANSKLYKAAKFNGKR